jgi:pyridoxal phosphate enzyme (YggS family)
VVDDVSSSSASSASLAQIPQRLAEVRRRIVEASAARGPDAVRLVAVSKGQPVEAIRAAWDQGQRDFGENYVQELVSKAEQLRELTAEGLRWHAIGQLQRNKARDAARIAAVIHAVDRADLAREIDRRAGAAGRRVEVLVEVNLGDEAAKGGCSPAEVGALLDAIAGCPNLAARGLMSIPPETDTSEQARAYFRALRELRDQHGGAAALPELSMGMSHDFEAAIAEGATIVRVGTAIFGPRALAGGRQ